MNAKSICAALAACAAFVSMQARAADVAGSFAQGRTHVVVSGGTGSAFNQSYLVLGLGASYYLIDGLNVGLFAESWSGNDPHFYTITPSVGYVFFQVPRVKPYVGAFYRRTFYSSSLPDIDSVGARAGAYLAVGRNAYVGLGAVYESYLDCNKSVYRDCSVTYPEISFTIAF